MKVTAQEEYGLRCILQLARFHARDPVTGRQIAESEGISLDYVSKLMMILRRSELVCSVRGVRGGYTLTRPPQDITLGEIMRALSSEDGIVLTSPDSHMCDHFSGHFDACAHLNACAIRPLWTVLARYLSGVLDRIVLTDLLQTEHQMLEVVEQVSRDSLQKPANGSAIKLGGTSSVISIDR